MRNLLLLWVLPLSLLAGADAPPVLIADPSPATIKALVGGQPVPAGKHAYVIPIIAKQSISFTSNAEEVIVGTVAMTGEGEIGSFSLDPDAGTGTGSITIPTASLATGNSMRDGHLRSEGWLDATKNPQIAFTDVTFSKIAPTVWRLSGTWTMHGVSKPLTTLANIRFIANLPGLGDNVARIKTGFDLDLKDFGVANPAVGSATVAQVWRVEVTLLAVPAK